MRVSHSFKIKNYTNKEFRYVRIRHTGKNQNGSDILQFDTFEIFGTLIYKT